MKSVGYYFIVNKNHKIDFLKCKFTVYKADCTGKIIFLSEKLFIS